MYSLSASKMTDICLRVLQGSQMIRAQFNSTAWAENTAYKKLLLNEKKQETSHRLYVRYGMLAGNISLKSKILTIADKFDINQS